MNRMNVQKLTVVITSTLIPNSKNWHGASKNIKQIPSDERYLQTLSTIQSLIEKGCVTIYLLDNSIEAIPLGWVQKIENMGIIFLSLPAIDTKTQNKGLSEIELLLRFCKLVKCENPILKISGRYTLNSQRLLEMASHDLIGRVFHRRRGFSEFSTKAYVVKNTLVLERILQRSAMLTRTLIYRFWTPFLLLRFLEFIKNVITNFDLDLLLDPPISIEEAFYHSTKALKIDCVFIDNLGITGILAAEGKLVCE